MKVYNQEKTKILEEYDLSKGYLKEDILVTHYDEIQAVEEQFHYETIREYANGGKDVRKVIDIVGVPYQAARDEEEDIYIYIPYTQEELESIKKDNLRAKREPILVAFDKYKTNVIYGIEEENTEEKIAVLEWYKKALNLDEDAIENVPDKIKYYL